MSSEIYSGYSGIFRPPHDATREAGSTIFCYADTNKTALVIIPLVPIFFLDAYKLARHPQYTKIYIVPPALDLLYITDTFTLYQELTKLGNKEIHIIAESRPEMTTSDDFLAHIDIGDQSIVISYRDLVTMELNISLLSTYNPPYRPSSDVIVSDGTKTIYFSQYMSNTKLAWFTMNKDNYPEIHTSFSYNTYGGLSYLQCLDYDKYFQDHLVVNGFVSIDEFNYCASNNIPTGKIRYNDFVHA